MEGERSRVEELAEEREPMTVGGLSATWRSLVGIFSITRNDGP